MIASDKFTANGRSRTRRRLRRRPASILRERIKSIPRTRKEKCQTAGCGCLIRASQRRRGTKVCQFHMRFDRFRLVNAPSAPHPRQISLTFLTAPCQRCQRIQRIQRNAPDMKPQRPRFPSCRGPPSHDRTIKPRFRSALISENLQCI